MLANCQLAKGRAPAAAGAVMDYVAFRATPLDANAETFDLGIPEHRLRPIGARFQSIDSSLRDLVAHARSPLRCFLGTTLGIPGNQSRRNLRQQNMALFAGHGWLSAGTGSVPKRGTSNS